MKNKILWLKTDPVKQRGWNIPSKPMSIDEIRQLLKPEILTGIMNAISAESSLHVKPSTKSEQKLQQSRRSAAILLPLCDVSTYDHSGNIISSKIPSVLFTVRNLKLRSHAGEIAFPGGLHDPTDSRDNHGTLIKMEQNVDLKGKQHLLSTMTREVSEELQIFKMHLLGSLQTVPDKTGSIAVTPFVAHIGEIKRHQNQTKRNVIEYVYDVNYNRPEICHVFSRSLSELLNPANIAQQKFRGNDKLIVPTFKGSQIPSHLLSDYKSLGEDHCYLNIWSKESVEEQLDPAEHFRIWGLTSWVLYHFLKNLIK
ncbi:hypothetical protein MIR68_002191 [Amoeboaphelidium protococcarum]|nr:hypothetical protein MIR68_002191 [Amoeboaphelidium protococcarum]